MNTGFYGHIYICTDMIENLYQAFCGIVWDKKKKNKKTET